MSNLEPPPNHIDQNYIELPRTLLRVRGVGIVTGALAILSGTAALLFGLIIETYSTRSIDLEHIAVSIGIFLGAIFTFTPYIRLDLKLPRDEPIRFNRHRRKVYFYQYRIDRLHPFSRKTWGVKPVAYNWNELTVEVYQFYAPLGYGGYKEEIRISVRKPGTDEIIDRIFFTDDIEAGKQYWATARLFMHEGAEALPDFVHPPWDWNEGIHSNPFNQRAPKVQWPTEMDLESRTAPIPEVRQ
ncbi:DUF6708 domain-containing protein [Pseudomonas sp. S31]|uniref:DUF6708 domain-containing protein n=1 Tax=Pseudomonas sp. S31 TaxID=1564473 RepID=UPI001F3AA165|nr:DUF6708 domain-containing protein [Pseudomonas sp. S31]